MQRGDPMQLELQKWNIPTDRPQKVDEKMGSKMESKMAHFFVFHTDCAKYLSETESAPYWILSENVTVNKLWNYRLWDAEGRNIKKTAESLKKLPKPCISKGWHLAR